MLRVIDLSMRIRAILIREELNLKRLKIILFLAIVIGALSFIYVSSTDSPLVEYQGVLV